ncbi:MAG: hypothetical protein L3J35_04855 [Bacteroidales bacterium]|nr:hypothetical protein [Bacteroidales bacterium]
MKLKIQNIFLSVILISSLLIFSACPKPQSYSEIPEIDFKQVILLNSNDTLGNPEKMYKLRFGLIDGDGNIGLEETDTIGIEVDSLYVNNFIATMFEVKNGDTIIADTTENYNFRIPYVEPQGQNKLLIADVFIEWTFPYYNDTLLFDSIFFEFYIIDRKLNKSNIEQTPVLYLDTVGEFPMILNNE